ncbi:hypothetical protein [Aliikangiella sp. IMCC44359]|uniref:hypothetical protein n=1 Tax=Aliikangiella sp. IMCC44359 TaxID=3459125 RepID=UPI00403ADF86
MVSQKIKTWSSKIKEQLTSGTETVSNKASQIISGFNEIKIKQLFTVSSTEYQYDTTYYFLFPDHDSPGTYIIQTHRVLPCGDYDCAKLTKRRIFEVPNIESVNIIKSALLKKLKLKNLKESDLKLASSEVLDELADKVDENNEKITKGLFVVGGIACLINPVTGVAIIGASFLPNVVNKLISSSSKKISANLKVASLKSRQQAAKDEALSQFKSIKTELHLNSVLNKLDRCIADCEFCALTDISDDEQTLKLTVPLVRELYPLKPAGWFSKSQYNSNLENYLKSILS